MAHVTVYYAGGKKGPNARADGNGGLLARGWYVRTPETRLGPLETRRCALNVANMTRLPVVEYAVNKRLR